MIMFPEVKRKKRKAPYKKPEAVRKLEHLAMEAARRKYPNHPEGVLAPRTFRDDTANALTKCIITYITLCGGFASRINSMGVYKPQLRRFTPGTQKRGLGDIWGTYQGKSIQIEVKHGRDKQSDAQTKIQAEQQNAGGYYFLARDFASFKEWFDRL